MKTSAEKSSSSAKSTTTSPFFAKAVGGDFFAPAIQTKLKVGQPGDKLEQEADRNADRVMRMPGPAAIMTEDKSGVVTRKEMEEKPIQRMATQEEKLQRKEEEKIQKKEQEVQRKGDGVPAVTSSVQTGITNKMSGGQPMDTSTRSFMESRMNADFSNVRVHSDAESGSLNNQLSARAFTYQNHVFFNRDQYQPGTSEGKHLLAHELTHTIQQGHAVQRSTQVSTTATQPHIQRLGIGDALDYFADAAYNIPGYRMFTIVIGVNPINMERADRSTANILRAIVEFLPGGRLITSVLDRYQVFERAGAYVEEQMNTLGITGASIRAAVMTFLDSLGWSDIFHLGSVWDRARRIFTEPIGRILTLIYNLGQRLMQFIWDAVLRPLASLAEGTRGWDLVKAILGRDPITGDPFPRTPATLIGGFMRLIGQEEVWENIQRGGAIQRAWVWFQTAMSELMGFIGQIPTLFINTLRSIEIADFLPPTNLFSKIFRVFGNFVGSFISWAGSKVLNLLEIIFSVVAPGAMPYLRRAAGAFQQIIRAPGSFVRNLINAVLQGFRGFASRIGTHLRNSIVQWLTGAMAGAAIYIPRAFELREIVKFVLSVLGLTWQNLRGRLVRHIGEPAVAALETTVSVVRTLITEGPAAAWEQIREMLGNLRDMVMTQVMQYVSTTIVQAAMTRLLTSLNPVGAFIQAIIAIYNTVMFLIERISQIIQVGRSVLDSIMAIAAGNIGAAAQRVEQTMAGLLTTVISFLARIAGLGRISDAVVGIINRIRRPIDAALDRVVNWLVGMARRFVRGVAQAGVPSDPNERLRLGLEAATQAVRRLPGNRIGRALLIPILNGIKLRYGINTFEPEIRGGQWWLQATINPTRGANSGKNAGTPISPTDLAVVTRRVVVSEIQNNPAVRLRIQQPVSQSIIVEGGLGLPASALQSRMQLQQHPAVSGPPFAIIAGNRTNEVQIQIGGGTVVERRARAGQTGAPLERVMGFSGQGHYNPDVLNEIRSSGLSEPAFALNMRMLTQTGIMEPGLNERQRASVRRATWLMFGTESSRNLANIVHAPMATGLVESEQASFTQVLTSQTPGMSGGILPATMGQLPATARTFEAQLSSSVPGLTPRVGGQTASATQVEALAQREFNLVHPFVVTQTQNNTPTTEEAENVVRVFVRRYYQMS